MERLFVELQGAIQWLRWNGLERSSCENFLNTFHFRMIIGCANYMKIELIRNFPVQFPRSSRELVVQVRTRSGSTHFVQRTRLILYFINVINIKLLNSASLKKITFLPPLAKFRLAMRKQSRNWLSAYFATCQVLRVTLVKMAKR